MIEVRIPKMGMSTIDVDVVQVLVQPGQVVGPADAVIEIESEKVTFQIEAGVAGRVAEVLVKEGDVIAVGEIVARIEEQ